MIPTLLARMKEQPVSEAAQSNGIECWPVVFGWPLIAVLSPNIVIVTADNGIHEDDSLNDLTCEIECVRGNIKSAYYLSEYADPF